MTDRSGATDAEFAAEVLDRFGEPNPWRLRLAGTARCLERRILDGAAMRCRLEPGHVPPCWFRPDAVEAATRAAFAILADADLSTGTRAGLARVDDFLTGRTPRVAIPPATTYTRGTQPGGTPMNSTTTALTAPSSEASTRERMAATAERAAELLTAAREGVEVMRAGTIMGIGCEYLILARLDADEFAVLARPDGPRSARAGVLLEGASFAEAMDYIRDQILDDLG